MALMTVRSRQRAFAGVLALGMSVLLSAAGNQGAHAGGFDGLIVVQSGSPDVLRIDPVTGDVSRFSRPGLPGLQALAVLPDGQLIVVERDRLKFRRLNPTTRQETAFGSDALVTFPRLVAVNATGPQALIADGSVIRCFTVGNGASCGSSGPLPFSVSASPGPRRAGFQIASDGALLVSRTLGATAERGLWRLASLGSTASRLGGTSDYGGTVPRGFVSLRAPAGPLLAGDVVIADSAPGVFPGRLFFLRPGTGALSNEYFEVAFTGSPIAPGELIDVETDAGGRLWLAESRGSSGQRVSRLEIAGTNFDDIRGTLQPLATLGQADDLDLVAVSRPDSALTPNSILVLDPATFGGERTDGGSPGGAVFRIDASSPEGRIASIDGLLSKPTGVMAAADGKLVVSDADACGLGCSTGNGGVITIDPATGSQAVLSSSPSFREPVSLALEASGDVLVLDAGGSGAGPRLLRVAPSGGAATVHSEGQKFVAPKSVTVGPDGRALVADAGLSNGPGSVIRIERGTSPPAANQSIVARGGFLVEPSGIAVNPDSGRIYVADPSACQNAGAIVAVDPLSGGQSVLSAGGALSGVAGLAVEADGNLIVVSARSGDQSLTRINVAFASTGTCTQNATNQSRILSPAPNIGPSLESPRAIAVRLRPCEDGRDNDGDGLVDLSDKGCAGNADLSERSTAACDDGIDNDGDLATDFGSGGRSDTGCVSEVDASERGSEACDNGTDDDADGRVDFPADEGCTASNDTSERFAGFCDDGVDNDGDGRSDFRTDGSGDAGCWSADDLSEDGDSACDDGVDNDGDGRVDFRTDAQGDPGCTSAGDESERAPTVECDDGGDNDGDGFIDYRPSGGDPSCSSPGDDSESCVDGDQDGVCDQLDTPNAPRCNESTIGCVDNCPLAPNPDQLDRGQPGLRVPDGIGDACQCGDVQTGSDGKADGVVDQKDAARILRLANNPLDPDVRRRFCDVNNDSACDQKDASRVLGAANRKPGVVLSQTCPAARGL